LTTLLSCSSVKNTDAQTDNLDSSMTNDTIRIANDTLEYEVIIIDPGFSTWLASRSLPRNYHSQSYLENKIYCGLENGIEVTTISLQSKPL
jgi:hypothetical protein